MNRPGVGVGVMILNENGEVLLGKRHNDPIKADSALHGEGSWTMPGGKLDFKEGLKDGAIREAFEETGIKANHESLELLSIANEIVHDAHFVTIGFVCRDFEGQPVIMEPDEITEWKWFNLNNLPSPIFFPSEKMINCFKNKRILHE